MTIQDKTFSKGDACFIFPSFPLEFQSLNPINSPIKTIDEGIYLADTPAYAFHTTSHTNNIKNIAKTDWIYPGFYLKSGECNMSIKVDPSVIDKEKKVWALIGSLLLIKPLYIHFGGCFTYGDFDSGLIQNPQKFDLRSNISFDLSEFSTQPQDWLKYDAKDFELAKKLYPIMYQALNDNHATNLRMRYNISQFMQAFIFEKILYARTLYSKLFPLLDSLAGNPSHKHGDKVSNRLGGFLANIPFKHKASQASQKIVTKRLKNIWELHRYPELHGHMKENIIPKGETVDSSGILFPHQQDLNDLKDLAEITRVAVLKTLLLNKDSQKKYLEIPIPLTGKGPQEEEAKVANPKRNTIASAFFDIPHNNHSALFFCSDLQDAS